MPSWCSSVDVVEWSASRPPTFRNSIHALKAAWTPLPRVVTVHEQQVDRQRPGRRDFLGAANVSRDEAGQAGAGDVAVVLLSQRACQPLLDRAVNWRRESRDFDPERWS